MSKDGINESNNTNDGVFILKTHKSRNGLFHEFRVKYLNELFHHKIRKVTIMKLFEDCLVFNDEIRAMDHACEVLGDRITEHGIQIIECNFMFNVNDSGDNSELTISFD